MAVFTILRDRQYSGVRQSDPVTAPEGISSIRLFVESTDFTDPAERIIMAIEESYDGGATWALVARNDTPGGGVARDGVSPLLPELMVEFGDDFDRHSRLFRGTIEVIGTVRFTLKAEVL